MYAEIGGVGNVSIYGSHSRETWNAYNYNYNAGIFEMFKMIYYEYPNLSWHDMGSSYHIYYTYDMSGQPEHGDLTDPKVLYVGSWWKHYYISARIVSPLGLWLNALSSYYKSVYTSSPH